jgi:serine/threonine-protein kinase
MELPTAYKISEELMATRFINNGDGTVTDGETNLIWQKDQAPKRMTWSEAQEYVDQLNAESFAGHNDWRLPTKEELLTLMLPKENNKRLHLDPIFGSQRCFWSADTRGHHVACYVDYYYGGAYRFPENYVNHSVRAVRGQMTKVVEQSAA